VVAIPTFIQCNITDGALVEVEAEAIDLDQTGGFTTRWWTEDDLFSSEPALDEAAGELFLPFGDSVVTTFVGDSSGRGTFLRTEVEVYDLVIAAVADLYDHAGGVSIQVARLDGPAVIPVAQLMPLFEDDCDSAPTVVVDDVESAGGKGEEPVLFACDGTLCLGEAPRDGGIATDYKVFVQAADRGGNTLETHLHVTICGQGETCRFPVLETWPEPIDKGKEDGK
jgi:hypothetical protein